MLEIPGQELEQFASEPELTVPLPQCVRDVPATPLQCFRNASTKFDFVAVGWGKWTSPFARNMLETCSKSLAGISNLFSLY
jgi:hypothetical protein